MLKQTVRAVVVWIFVMTFLVSSVSAQTAGGFKINVPFQFFVDGRVLPAGIYVVDRTDPTRPDIVTLKRVDGGIIRVVLTLRVEKEDPSEVSSLIFILREGKHYLFQVWSLGAMSGRQIRFAYEEQRSEQQSTGLSFVTVRAKHQRSQR